MAYAAMGALLHALDVEVKIPAAPDKEPVWAKGPNEANNLIFDSVQALFRDVLSAKVHSDRDRTDPQGFTNYLGVYALPTPQHNAVVLGDLSALARRLETDLAARFGPQHGAPQVQISPIRTFAGDGQSNFGNPGVPTFYSPPPAYNQPPPGFQAWGGGPPPPGPHDPHRGRAVVMTMGILLGGLVIATVVLGVMANHFYDTRQESFTSNKTLKEEVAKRDSRIADLNATMAGLRSNYALLDNDLKSITDLRNDIVALYKDRGGRQPEMPPEPNGDQLYKEAISTYRSDLQKIRDELARRPRRPPEARLPPPQSPPLIIPGGN